jgi:SAM-dependent methyltransferase
MIESASKIMIKELLKKFSPLCLGSQTKEEKKRLLNKEPKLLPESSLLQLTESNLFRQFEEKLKLEFGVEYKKADYPTFRDYISSLFMVDALNKAFINTKTALPSKLRVLDVGAGKWQYIKSLYQFLQNYEEKREVSLTGVDIKGGEYQTDIEKIKRNLPADYLPVNILSLNNDNNFDVVFMAHMLSSPDHFKKWGLKDVSPEQLFKKGFELLKQGGLFIGMAHEYGGEASIFNDFPKDRKIYDKFYSADLGDLTEFLSGYYTFNDNVIVLGRK